MSPAFALFAVSVVVAAFAWRALDAEALRYCHDGYLRAVGRDGSPLCITPDNPPGVRNLPWLATAGPLIPLAVAAFGAATSRMTRRYRRVTVALAVVTLLGVIAATVLVGERFDAYNPYGHRS